MLTAGGITEVESGLLRMAPYAMLVVDQDGHIVQANTLAERLFAYPPGALTGQPLEILIPAGLRDLLRQRMAAYIRNPLDCSTDWPPAFRGLRHDGRELAVLITLNPMEAPEGLHILASFRDFADDPPIQEALKLTAAELERQSHAVRPEPPGAGPGWRATSARQTPPEALLHENEVLYRQLVENQPDLICRFLPDTTLTFVNAAYARFFDRCPEELLGRRFIEFLSPTDQAKVLEQLAAITPAAPGRRYEHRAVGADKVPRWHLWHDLAFYDAEGRLTGFQSVGVDITERKEAEARLETINRALQLRSACNRALIHAEDEAHLFHEICRLIVGVGGYRLAWVGLAALDAARTVRPVGQAGYEAGYLESVRISWADEENGRGPAGTAIRTGQPVVARDLTTDPHFAPWRDEALKRGYGSCIALPLRRNAQALGALNIYAITPDAFSDEEIQLLSDLADDLAYGLSALRVRDRQKQIAMALQESEARFRRLAEATFEGIAITRGGRLLDVSDQLAAMMGYAPGELIGRQIIHLVAPEARELTRQRLRSGNMEPFELAVLRKDGSTFLVEVRVRSAFFRGQEVRISAVRDITERKEREEALCKSEERFKHISQTISDFAYSCVKQAGGTYTPDWMAGAVERISGYSIEEVKSWGSWKHMVIEEDRPLFEEKIIGLPAGGSSVCELRIRRKDGTVRWLTAYTVSVPDRGSFMNHRLYGGCQDITDRKLAEEERLQMERKLLHSQKLESLGVLAGGIAHDFNNLLMAILGYADLALDDLSPGSPARPKLGEIVNASRRAADLCRQMLAYSGKGKFVIERLYLNQVINEIIHLLKTTLSKKVLLNLNLERNLPPIEGDPSQVRQVLMNLVLNASEAIDARSGVITISTGARYCDSAYLGGTYLNEELPEGIYVSLEVSDTGCGMDRETQARIFEPFFTTKFTGRGLGMAAVLGIMRGHRGAVKIYSEPGRGTTFQLLFPAAPSSPDGAVCPGQEREKPWQGEGTVLLVDDEDTVLAVGREMLERLGFSVLAAEHGRQALELYEGHREEIVCVLLDLTMPHMDGEETFRELRRMNPDVRVIICSGYSEQEIASRFAGKGLTRALQKPYLLDDLRHAMQEALKGGTMT